MLEARIGLSLGALELDLELAVEDREVVAVLGPNGAGKTTLLRALAGLIPIDRGLVTLDGNILEDPVRRIRLPPEARPVGVVFQDLRLFPHLSVLDNVGFGLRARGRPRREAEKVAAGWLELLQLAEYAKHRPDRLSGGQAQRVALARALAVQPRLLLLDEPLSALDASTQLEVRRELRLTLAGFQGARLLITHDPLEAMALADRLVVIEAGRVVQSGTAAEVAQRPRTPYVADLVGVNLYRGRMQVDTVLLEAGGILSTAGRGEGTVFAVFHPRAVSLWPERPAGTPRNVWRARATGLYADRDRVRVELTGRPPVVAEVTPAAAAELGLTEGSEVWVSVKATEITVYPA